ncbi:MAG TPA: CYTH domain-containing protein [Elusimicrobiota bacterium]|nr:CYTH domain-containing protein [Elusimicrobiota bacterium]
MGREIERKFLVKGEGWRKGAKRSRLSQGYLLAQKGKSVRVRLEDGRGTVTIKGPSRGAGRAEYEYPIPADDARELLRDLCEKPLIEKTRHRVKHGGLIWEVDEFAGANRGLIVAEVELSRTRQKVALPPWIGKEVTGDPRYLNANLFKKPYRSWR